MRGSEAPTNSVTGPVAESRGRGHSARTGPPHEASSWNAVQARDSLTIPQRVFMPARAGDATLGLGAAKPAAGQHWTLHSSVSDAEP